MSAASAGLWSAPSGDGSTPRRYLIVDVFTDTPYLGNPVAVVLGAEGFSSEQMQSFARWTNLSETTFVLPPRAAGADYLVRIFTPTSELPFAGHPTLGTCHAWLEAGGRPADPGAIVQECGAGLITVRRTDAGLAFAAGIGLRATTGVADADTGAPTANDVVANVWYA